ncbi:MAG: pyridoxal-phosphate dependent enzyme [Anaerolineae bacterium]
MPAPGYPPTCSCRATCRRRFLAEIRALGAQVTAGRRLDHRLRQAGAQRCGRRALVRPVDAEGATASRVKRRWATRSSEQMGWRVPDVIIYPTGGGTGIVGIWKALDEMQTLGWIGAERPRIVSVQTEGCAPIVRAYQRGEELAPMWENAATVADGLRVPAAVGDFLILRAVRNSNGTALAVSDDDLIAAQRELGASEGIYAAPEAAATLSALRRLVEQGQVKPDERVVLLLTGNGLKYGDLNSRQA